MTSRPTTYRPASLATFERPTTHAPTFTPRGSRVRVQIPDRPDGADSVRLVVAGDWAAVREFSSAADVDPASLYGSLHPRIADADLSVVNLECPLGGETPIIKDGPNFRCEPRCALALARAGFHVATLANNHIYDQGAEGLDATLGACRDAGLLTVGAGRNTASAMEPLFIEVKGLRVGLLSLSEVSTIDRQHGGAAPMFDVHVLDRCREARRHCDHLLVIVHGGKEYAPFPPPYWYRQVLAVAGAGADAVIGHHPHVPQGMTLAQTDSGQTVPVVFSTGNFVFPPRTPTAVMSAWMPLGYLVELRLASDGLHGLDLVPYRIELPHGVRGLQADQVTRFTAFIAALSAPLTDPAQVEQWFNDYCDYFWRHEWFNRVEGLTAKLCRDDMQGLRHGRSHFQIRAHSKLIDRVIARKLAGTYGDTPAERLDVLQRWFRGEWPERVLPE
ncbi:MAG: CapA family protein [Planctomycetota bacterium]